MASDLASGATTVTPYSPRPGGARSLRPLAAPAVTVVRTALLVVPLGFARLQHAGTPIASSNGLDGAPRVLPTCTRAGACTHTYRFAAPATITVGDYAMELVLSVSQPNRGTGTAFAFDTELAVHVGSTWFVGRGYLGSGTTLIRGGAAFQVTLVLDLNTRTVPTVLATEYAIDLCSTVGACP